MSNIKFSYRYRDSGNYKKFDSVIFSNPDGIDLAELENLIRSKMMDGEFFYATEWNLPEFFTECIDFRIDPTWHEFERLAYTEEPADAQCGLTEFMELVRRTGEYGFIKRLNEPDQNWLNALPVVSDHFADISKMIRKE